MTFLASRNNRVSVLYRTIGKQALWLIVFFQLSRFLFFVFNHAYFNGTGVLTYLALALQGLRFDLSVVLLLNMPYWVLVLLPFPLMQYRGFRRAGFLLQFIPNTLALLFDLADIGYFPFSRKRMSAEVFHLLGKKSDFVDLLPSYLREFWPVVLLSGVFIFLMYRFLKRTQDGMKREGPVHHPLREGLLLACCLVGMVIGIRGGLQLKPIQNHTALLYTSHDRAALVLNTPFSILHTLQSSKLQRLHDFNEATLHALFNPIKQYSTRVPMRKDNVVLIILESFGRQYTGLGGRTSYTPFLDSLMQHALVFPDAFANSHRSADGIPACIAGIPVFTEEPFTTSAYSGNAIEALPILLKRSGYHTSFYHGGTNGTMSFDIFAHLAGFDRYVGRTEYGHDQDYDGAWGIWDDPFLQFYAQSLNKEKAPFFSTVFTLSSHEPFRLPASSMQKAYSSLPGIYRGIRYSDEALRHFFQTASAMPWFKHTLFVITADHNFLANQDSLGYYNNGIGLYAVPVLYYKPDDPDLSRHDTSYTQQIDILPSVLDYLHYPYPFFAFGQSVFDHQANHYVYTQMSEHHQLLMDGYVMTSDGEKLKSCYAYKADSLLRHPIQQDSVLQSMRLRMKAYRQLLQNSMIDNSLSVSRFTGKR